MTDRSHIILELAEERIWIEDQSVQLHRSVYRLLRLFVEQEGKLVTKRDILRDVWPDTNVSDASVKDCVKNLRSVLGDSAANPTYIETVRGRGYRFLGGVELRERVVPSPDGTAPEEPDSHVPASESGVAVTKSRLRSNWRPLALGLLFCAVVVAVSLSWRPSDDPVPARPDMIALPIPEKPSLAVAPFINVSGKEEHDWLSIGLSSNVITAVASSPDIVVISQNALSSMSDSKPGEIAERYGVRYVLDGTILRDGEKLRVSARLTDALEGRTLWSDKWDRPMDDIFAIQDEIADAIFEELQVRLTLGEQARKWRLDAGSIEDMRALILGRAGFQTFTHDGYTTAALHWNGMLERNPDLPLAMNLQGWLLWNKIMVGLSTDPVADLLMAQKWAGKAIEGGLMGHPHVLIAATSGYLGQREKALDFAEQAYQHAPGEADVVQIAGFVYAINGKLDEGINLMQKGMRLEPDYPDWLAGSMTTALFKVGRWKETRELATDVIAKNVKDENARFHVTMTLVVLSVLEGRMNEAKSRVADLLAIRPNTTIERISTEPRYSTIINKIGEPGYGERYIAALKEAGLPEGR